MDAPETWHHEGLRRLHAGLGPGGTLLPAAQAPGMGLAEAVPEAEERIARVSRDVR